MIGLPANVRYTKHFAQQPLEAFMRGLKTLMLALSCLSAVATAADIAPTTQLKPLPDIRQSGFIYCVSGILNTFNPQMASSGLTVDTLAAQLYDRLLDVDPYTYRLIPELAQNWEVLDGGATYVLHLRKDVPFQTTDWFKPTRKMNADDVVFSFNRMFDPKHPYHNVNGGHYPYFESLQFSDAVQSVRKLDNSTVEIRLKQPDASFLWHLATHYAPILSAEYANNLAKKGKEEEIDRLPVGTGPFMLNEYHAGQYIRLDRNDAFWKGKPRMPQVIIDLGAGGTGRLSKLLTGECDVLAYPAASQLSILRDDPRLRLTLRPGMNVAYLAFNTRKPPLDNLDVRRAIAYSINNQRLMQSIYYGTAETAASLLPRASWAYDSEAKITEYNPEKSRELLKQAGVTNLHLQLWVPTASQAYNPSPLKTAELIQADMAQVGIKVSIVPVEGRFQEARLSDMSHDMTLSGWATDSNDPDSFFRPLLSCAAIQSQTNLAHWCDPSFDSLLHKALLSQQLSQRIEDYQDAQKILEEQLPILPLASSLRLQAYRYDIKGLVLSPFGNASFAGVYREKQPEPEAANDPDAGPPTSAADAPASAEDKL
ncbi:Peptide transport periplasmic protein SapA [Enterobacteriaceae bacterium bta3-1]|nr:Peptide transport periplasmic protein SapA [Enterobacteriaceae bacterium bta3-1]